jgi:hypothetical protein
LDTLNETENFHSINSYSISGTYKEAVEEINSKNGQKRRNFKERDEKTKIVGTKERYEG